MIKFIENLPLICGAMKRVYLSTIAGTLTGNKIFQNNYCTRMSDNFCQT